MNAVLELDAVAQGLVPIAQDANSISITDAELVRRLNLIVDPFLDTPDYKEKALKRAELARALQARCNGAGCARVVSHILRDD